MINNGVFQAQFWISSSAMCWWLLGLHFFLLEQMLSDSPVLDHVANITKPCFSRPALLVFSISRNCPEACQTWTQGKLSSFCFSLYSVCQTASDFSMATSSSCLPCPEPLPYPQGQFSNTLCCSGLLTASLFQFCLSLQSSWLILVDFTSSLSFLSGLLRTACILILKHSSQNSHNFAPHTACLYS